jgi:pimeloyl-ACP methyl ester carboxylesterase
MINVIIPGFSTDKYFFYEFLELCRKSYNGQSLSEVEETIQENDFIILDNKFNSYNDIGTQLNSCSVKYGAMNIFGWSLGSLFALKWTIENKKHVSSLFLTGATSRFTEKEGYDNGISKDILSKMTRLVKIRRDKVMSDFYNIILEKTGNIQKYHSKLMSQLPETGSLINGLNELLEIDITGVINTISIPVIIYQGQNDRTTPLYGAEFIAKEIKSSSLHLYDGGHCFFLEYPELCAKAWKDLICPIKK